MSRAVITVYVENKYGVLARVTGLFMRKGYNIDSLAVGETEDPNYSRITLSLNGDSRIFDQIVKQLSKLYNVKGIKLLDSNSIVSKEFALIKIKNDLSKKQEIIDATEFYRARMVDYSADSITIEITGEPAKVKAFVEVLKPFGILEMCRTGAIALERGNNILEKNI